MCCRAPFCVYIVGGICLNALQHGAFVQHHLQTSRSSCSCCIHIGFQYIDIYQRGFMVGRTLGRRLVCRIPFEVFFMLILSVTHASSPCHTTRSINSHVLCGYATRRKTYILVAVIVHELLHYNR